MAPPENKDDIESMLDDQQSIASVNTEDVKLTNGDKEMLSKLTEDDITEFKGEYGLHP